MFLFKGYLSRPLGEPLIWESFLLPLLSNNMGMFRLQNVLKFYGCESDHWNIINMSPWQSNNLITKVEITTFKFKVCERSDQSASLCATSEQRTQIRIQMSDLHYMKTKVHNWHTMILLSSDNRRRAKEKKVAECRKTCTHTLTELQEFLTFWKGAWACQLLECDSTYKHVHAYASMHTHSHAWADSIQYGCPVGTFKSVSFNLHLVVFHAGYAFCEVNAFEHSVCNYTLMYTYSHANDWSG